MRDGSPGGAIRLRCCAYLLCFAGAAAGVAGSPSVPVVVGVDRDFPPYEYVDESGSPAGFDVDLARAVAAAAGFRVEFQPGHGRDLFSALEDGRVQALAGVFHFEALDRTLAFSQPIVGVEFAVFGRTGAAEVSGIRDLRGKAVLVNGGSQVEEWLGGRAAPFKLIQAGSASDTLRRLAGGEADYAVASRLEGTLVIGKLKLGNVVALPVPVTLRPYCFAVRRGDAQLAAAFDRGLASVKASGEYATLDRKWFALLRPQRTTLIWIFRHGALFVAPLLLLLVAVVAWSRTLARRIESRTRALREELAERKRVEDALRESETRFRALAENVPFAIMIVQDERIAYANRAAAEIHREAPERLLGVSPWRFVHPDYVPIVQGRARSRPAEDAGAPERYELRIARGDGTECWVDVSAASITHEGRPAVVLALSDITERRRSQETQAAIYEISEAAQTAENLDELFARLHRAVGRLMPATNFYIALHDLETDLLSFPYFVDEQDERPEPFKPGRGMTGYVLRTGEPLLATDDRIAELERMGELRSLGAPSLDWLGVPLIVRERTIGVLAVQSYTGNVRYSDADLQILSYVSNQAAQAIERKQAEQELRESQRKLFTLMGNLPGMAYRCAVDRNWTFEFVSDGCFDLTGYHPAELVGNLEVGLCDPADLDAVNRAVDDAIVEHRAYEVAYRLRTASGGVKWVWERGRGVFSANGELLALEGLIADISERRAAEEALRESEERYRLALQATQEIMYDWDIVAGAVVWNPNVRKALGYTPAEMGATPEEWTARLHPDDAERVGAEVDVALAGREVFTSEYRLRRKDGEWAVLLDRGLIIRDRNGRAVRMVGAMTDLTERKRLEDQLRQAQKIEAVGRLAGGIAHDFNNLLTAVLGSTELLQRRLDADDHAQHELATIHRAALRAADFTKGLLAFARRQVLEPVNLDLNAFVSDALPMLRHLIPENIRIEFRPSEDLETIRADRGQLTQILMNLCVNARDAMPTGGTITVATSCIMMDEAFAASHLGARLGLYVCLSVADTGQGIDPRDMARIFEPFFTTKDTGKGTGLGLSTVYGIVKQHGGFVYADSEPGSGSRFNVYLPIPSIAGEPSAQPAEAMPGGGSEVILVVEDEPEVRQILVEALAGLGYQVREAADGVDALAMLQKGLPADLVLTDVVMPRMGGMELCSAARALVPELKFLFSSGYTEDSVHIGFIKKEGVFFLAKPYGIDTLARKVREVLESPPLAVDVHSE
ncbi:MAG TPA: PAS domain S-box protein [Thermoanaerobaculaceae bacterium]|nr:PAS domain S-box protein [Thermoanaerobaculaceae bacterium]